MRGRENRSKKKWNEEEDVGG